PVSHGGRASARLPSPSRAGNRARAAGPGYGQAAESARSAAAAVADLAVLGFPARRGARASESTPAAPARSAARRGRWLGRGLDRRRSIALRAAGGREYWLPPPHPGQRD